MPAHPDGVTLFPFLGDVPLFPYFKANSGIEKKCVGTALGAYTIKTKRSK